MKSLQAALGEILDGRKILLRALAFGAALLVILFTVFTSAGMLTEKAKKDTEASLGLIGENLGSIVRGQVVSGMRVIEGIAGYIGSQDTFDPEYVLSILTRQFAPVYTLQVGLADSSGTVRMPKGVTFDASQKEYFLEAMQGRTFVSHATEGIVPGEIVNLYAAPVRHEGEIKAVLIMARRSIEFRQALVEKALSGDFEHYVIDRQGNPIFVEEGGFLGSVSENALTQLDGLTPAKGQSALNFPAAMQDNQAGIYYYMGEDGLTHNLSYAPVGLFDWYVLSFIPDSVVQERYQEYNSFNSRLLMNSAIIALMVGLMLLLVQLAKNREIALANRRLELITSNMQGGVLELFAGPELPLLFVSDGFLRLSGFSRQEITTQFHDNLLPLLAQEDRSILETVVAECQQDQFTVECRLLHETGQTVTVQLFGLFASADHSRIYCTVSDISEKQSMIKALASKTDELLYREMELQLAMSGANLSRFDYICEDGQERIESNSDFSDRGQSVLIAPLPQALVEFGIPEEQYIQIFYDMLQQVRAGESQVTFQIRSCSQGRSVWNKVVLTRLSGNGTDNVRGVGIVHDITQEKEQEERLRHIAQSDQMTGLYNKTSSQTLVGGLLPKLRHDMCHALFVIDVDNFKGVNDRLGHSMGDQVLVECAKALKSLFRAEDVIGRIGGDEFMVFMSNVSNRDVVLRKAEDICQAFREVGGEEYSGIISASIGIAFATCEDAEFLPLFKNADTALYEAKQKGKNGYHVSGE